MLKNLISLTKAVVSTATLPIDLAADIVTMGGAVNDKKRPYTAEKIRKVMGHLDDATD